MTKTKEKKKEIKEVVEEVVERWAVEEQFGGLDGVYSEFAKECIERYIELYDK